MRLHTLSITFFLTFTFSCLWAQPKFTVDKIFFPGEKISKVSVGSQGVWALKGDSVGLLRVDGNDKEIDYSSATSSLTKPIRFLNGSTQNSTWLATENDLYTFKDGALKKKELSSLGITLPIKGLDNIDGGMRLSTYDTYYTSYDHFNSVLAWNNQTTHYDIKLLGGARLFQGSPRCETPANAYSVFMSLPQGGYQASLRYDYGNEIYDYAFGQHPSYGIGGMFIAQKSGLWSNSFDCHRAEKRFLKDTITFCLQNLGDTILIGTESGLFWAYNKFQAEKVFKCSLTGFEEVAIYSMDLEIEKGYLWLGTNKGLLRITFPIQQNLMTLDVKPKAMHHIGGKSREIVLSSVIDDEENTLVTGYFKEECFFGDTSLTAYNGEDYFLAKYNKHGKILWARSVLNKALNGSEANEEGRAVAVDKGGNVYVFCNAQINRTGTLDSGLIYFDRTPIKTDFNTTFIVKYDKNGYLIWAKSIPDTDNKLALLKADDNGNVYLGTFLLSSNGATNYDGTNLLKFNETGEAAWAIYLPNFSRLELRKNGILVAGTFDSKLSVGNYTLSCQENHAIYILSLDGMGNVQWGNYISRGNMYDNYEVSIDGIGNDNLGNVYIGGSAKGNLKCDAIVANSPPFEPTPLFFAKLNSKGKFIWAKKMGAFANNLMAVSQLTGCFSTDDYGFSTSISHFTEKIRLGPQTFTTRSDYQSAYLLKLDPNGNLIKANTLLNFDRNRISYFFAGSSIDRKGNISTYVNTFQDIETHKGVERSFGEGDIFLFQFKDSLLAPFLNKVSGKIFNDKNQNKVFDNSDDPLANFILKASPGDIYSQTDTNGTYEMYLPKGNYSINQIIPENKRPLFTQVFPSEGKALPLNLHHINQDTSGLDFVDKAIIVPYIDVDISSIRRRRCFRGTTYVKYCNLGLADAPDLKVKVEFPAYVIPISSSTPWTTKTGRILVYEVGNVPKGTCKTITITDSVQCGDQTILGLTQCTKALISPPNTVIPTDPNWDQSDVVLKGACKSNGFVSTTLTNVGTGNMTQTTHVKVFLDSAIAFQKEYKLASLDSISLSIPAKGKSFRMEATQTDFHPGSAPATLAIEGCKTPGITNVSKGLTNKLPINDQAEEVEVSCMEIIGSYDPNDKQVFPSGVTQNHNVEEGTELEYLLRFQNSGSDTAFTVVVTDTLSTLFDISTFKPGVTSHPCTWNISGKEKPLLTCRFDKINLPDSTTNEVGSHGFLKFTIKPIPNITGQQIYNKGFIYFDYNDPVITNEVFTTIGLPEFKMETIAVQNCSTPIAAQSDSLYFHLCGDRSVEFNLPKNDTVYSNWQILKGAGTITEPSASRTKIENVADGVNTFVLQHQFCNLAWSHAITVKRDETPSALRDTSLRYCEGSRLDSIYVKGTGIEWYDPRDMNQLLAKGNRHLAPHATSTSFYVKQKINDCSSEISSVQVEYIPRPLPPLTHSGMYCYNDNYKTVMAEGQNIKWYYDTLAYPLAGLGNSLLKSDVAKGTSLSLFATQSVRGCESKSSEATLTVKSFDVGSVRIPNVISRSKNEGFYLPKQTTNECVGTFTHVTVSDASGRQVFYSENEAFIWYPNSTSQQVFLFQIRFEDKVYKGKLFVKE